MAILMDDAELIEAMARRAEEWQTDGTFWIKGDEEANLEFDAWVLIPEYKISYVWDNGGPAAMLAVAKQITPTDAATILREAEEIDGCGSSEDNPDYVEKLENHPTLLAQQFREILPEYLKSVDFLEWRHSHTQAPE